MNRRVRIFSGEVAEESMIIGWSASAAQAADSEEFKDFMTERGYRVSDLPPEARPEGSTYRRHVEIKPPLSSKDMQDLGQLCVGGFIDNQKVEALIDGHNNHVLVIDNTEILPNQDTETYIDGPIMACK